MHKIVSIILISGLLTSCSMKKSVSYFDQEPPTTTPKLFAPEIVNTDSIEINTVFNASFTEMFFTRIINEKFVIHHSELVDGNWRLPKPIQMFSDPEKKSVAIDPSISQDGNTMYFLGISPEDRLKKHKPDIYKSKKVLSISLLHISIHKTDVLLFLFVSYNRKRIPHMSLKLSFNKPFFLPSSLIQKYLASQLKFITLPISANKSLTFHK